MKKTQKKLDETTKKESKKKNIWRELLEDVFMVICVLVFVFLIKHYVLINAWIPSGSMENTIMEGDRIFGSRLSYTFGEPERGDIVIFKFPDNENELFIKRLIGLPGDKILIRNGLVYINDSEIPLDEPYIRDEPMGDWGPYYVPEDCYFMLGDNRDWSKDSRLWENTYVTRDEILAKAVFRYYPFHKIGTIK